MTTAVRERPAGPLARGSAGPGPGPAVRVQFRLHRRTLWTVAAMVTALGVTAGAARIWERATVDERCTGVVQAGAGIVQEDCGLFEHGDAVRFLEMQGTFNALFLLLWPALVAAFVAGPLVGRKLESGLHRFEWTQSLTPARWTALELAATAAVAAVASLTFSALFRIAEQPGPSDTGRWWLTGGFEGFGPVLLAHTLLAVGAGALAGVVIRRGFPAMAAAGTFSLLLVGLLGWARWQLWPTSTVTGQGGLNHLVTMRALPDGSRWDSSGRVTSAGEHVSQGICVTPTGALDCPPGVRLTGWYAEYHPRSVFWWTQGTETLLLLGLAAVLTYAAFRVLRRLTP